jgi:hypothetical protein
MRLISGLAVLTLSLTSVLALNACSDNNNSRGESLGLPMLKPIVEGATPSALQGAQSLAQSIGTASSCGDGDASCVVQEELAGIMLDLMDNNLEMFDQRLAEINQRTAENTRECTLETPTAWTASDLPGGEERTFYLQCAENHGQFLSVYFGVHEGKAYLIERTRGTLSGNNIPHDDSSAGDQILMAIADMSGNSVEIWAARHKGYSEFPSSVFRYNRSWLYINADRSANSLEASISGPPWPGHSLTCGATLRANDSHFQLGMTLGNVNTSWSPENFCDLAVSDWPTQAIDASGCYNGTDFSSSPGECTGIEDLSAIPDLRAHAPGNATDLSLMGGGCDGATAPLDSRTEPGANGCYARAYTLITNSGFPSLRDFNDILIEDE